MPKQIKILETFVPSNPGSPWTIRLCEGEVHEVTSDSDRGSVQIRVRDEGIWISGVELARFCLEEES
jgi:hypothetical protein